MQNYKMTRSEQIFVSDPVSFVATCSLVRTAVVLATSAVYFKLMMFKPRSVIVCWFGLVALFCALYCIGMVACDGNVVLGVLIFFAVLTRINFPLYITGFIYYKSHLVIEISGKYGLQLSTVNTICAVAKPLLSTLPLMLASYAYEHLSLVESTTVITLTATVVCLSMIVIFWKPLDSIETVNNPIKGRSRGFSKELLDQYPLFYNHRLYLLFLALAMGGLGASPTMWFLYMLEKGMSVMDLATYRAINTWVGLISLLLYPFLKRTFLTKTMHLLNFSMVGMVLAVILNFNMLSYVWYHNDIEPPGEELTFSELDIWFKIMLVIKLLNGIPSSLSSLSMTEFQQVMIKPEERGTLAGIEHLLSALLPALQTGVLLAIPSELQYLFLFGLSFAGGVGCVGMVCVTRARLGRAEEEEEQEELIKKFNDPFDLPIGRYEQLEQYDSD